ncbi:glycoside hydrolase family 97 protein [Lutibacter citreus]|uniref:glycoside hydrolase family 97 protein n=1 Tax=Lutibacter citreus TaxID=2138210 RepID=UPI000DBEA11B|nr:glycoside hydrolase family 97 protein [Lutibacter citreus]
MKKLLVVLALIIVGCNTTSNINKNISSPNGENKIEFYLNEEGQLNYKAKGLNVDFLTTSSLGFELKKHSLKNGFEILSSEEKTEKSEWKTVWGQRETIINHYNELTLHLKQQESNILINVIARVFDDYKAWWNFADYDNYEKVYYNSPISKIGDSINFARRPDKEERANMCNTPTTIEVNDTMIISIHEADLTNYAGMNLLNTLEGTKLKAHLTPWLNGDLVRASTPFQTPWRTIQMGRTAGDLVESDLIINLNPPCAYKTTDWIETYKYIGIWWELHIGKSAWAEKTQFGKPINRPHGANTKNAKYHIDFAAKHGIHDVLIEGWDKGWDNMEGSWTGYGIFDWKTSTDDFDIEEVCNYGKEKGVRMMMYHETISDIDHYEPAMDELYKMCSDLGMKTVKVGYTGDVNYDTENKTYRQHHHGQYMVRHYKKMVQKAAEYKLLIVNHEPIKFTGEQRTYPNLMAREGARGQEYNAWSKGNSPEHGVILPFTRILGGPIDYTPGIFSMILPDKDWSTDKFRVRSTICKQLAYYLTMYSPIQMAADLPENYEGNKAFQFIKDVPTNWSNNKVLNSKIGDYYTVARKERGTENWYLGSITDENSRDFEIDLSFLSEGEKYIATIYADANDADWESNPEAFVISKKEVSSAEKLKMKLAAGGGQAIAFKVLY